MVWLVGCHKQISMLYGMLDQTHLDQVGLPLTVRSVFFIGPDKKIKLILTYPASTGRNFAEVIRCIDSLKLATEKKVATPVDWNRGDDVCILPSVTEDEARLLFPTGYRVRNNPPQTPNPIMGHGHNE